MAQPAASKVDLGARVRRDTPNIGLDDKTIENVTNALSAILADTYRLTIKTHVYHWNVVGPLFRSFHLLSEEHYENLFEAADALAERVRALGQPSHIGRSGRFELGTVGVERADVTTRQMIEDLIADHEHLVRQIRAAAEFAEENGDYATHDLLVGRLAFHEKAIWMLGAIVAE